MIELRHHDQYPGLHRHVVDRPRHTEPVSDIRKFFTHRRDVQLLRRCRMKNTPHEEMGSELIVEYIEFVDIASALIEKSHQRSHLPRCARTGEGQRELWRPMHALRGGFSH